MSWRFHLLFGGSRLRRAVVVVAAVALAMFALPFATPVAQAQANAIPNGCLSQYNTLCSFRDANYSGTRWLFHNTSGQPCCYWWYVGSSANDQISSLFNMSTHSQFAYVAKNCPADSQWTWLDQGYGAPNLANNKWPDQSSMNDSISAWAFGPGGQPSPAFPPHGSRMFGGC